MGIIVFIGNSHLTVLQRALNGTDQILGRKVKFVQLFEKELGNTFVHCEGGLAVNPSIEKRFEEFKKEGDIDFVFSCFRGSLHDIMGLVTGDIPYDFMIPTHNELPTSRDADLIPYGIVLDEIKRRTNYFDIFFQFLKKNAKHVAHLESPPMIATGEHIRQFPGSFQTLISQRDISPRYVRFKLWLAVAEVVQDYCRTAGIGYLPAPHETLEPEGWLKPEFWGKDPTHGNDEYGRAVMRQVVAQIGACP